MTPLQWGAAAACGVAAGYQCFALAATLRHLGRRDRLAQRFPKVSILKPIRGLDERMAEAIRSHARLDWPEYEVLLGVRDANDRARPLLEQLAAEFPHLHVFECRAVAPNGKVGVLMDLARQATGEIILVNDSDITVPVDYLRRVVAPLEDPQVGLVTCLYRAEGTSSASEFEALGITTEFAPSVLTAPLVGVNEFALGSTLCLRRADLERLGGFEAIQEYLADDYQLGKKIVGLGLRNHLTRLVVGTTLEGGWGAVWAHQVRWARTIRLSRGDGYAGLPVTYAGLWGLLALLAGLPGWALAPLIARCALAFVAGLVLQDRRAVLLCWLAPVRDLFSFAVWVAGFGGDAVVWRDRRLRLAKYGRIVAVELNSA
jgi:ceramide glucosyltransferase